MLYPIRFGAYTYFSAVFGDCSFFVAISGNVTSPALKMTAANQKRSVWIVYC